MQKGKRLPLLVHPNQLVSVRGRCHTHMATRHCDINHWPCKSIRNHHQPIRLKTSSELMVSTECVDSRTVHASAQMNGDGTDSTDLQSATKKTTKRR
jgi:hypothetical protein